MAREHERTNLKKGRASFNLVGKVKLTDNTFKMNNVYDSGWTDNKMYIGIDCGEGNIVYAEMSGGYFKDGENVITPLSNEGKDEDGKSKRLTIQWEDRLDESWLDMVYPMSIFTVGLKKNSENKTIYKKFLHKYDAVKYAKENLEDGMIVNVKGNLSYSEYNGNVNVKKEITSIVLSSFENESDFKAVFNQTILIDSDTIGKYDDEKNAVMLNAYVVDYVGSPKINGKKVEIKKNISFPLTFELSIKDDKEINKRFANKWFKVKRGKVTQMQVIGKISEGSSVVQITKDDLDDDIKELIEIGAYTLEEISGKAIGDSPRGKRLIITKPEIITDDKNNTRVACEEELYEEEDLLFYEQALNEAGVDTEETKDEVEEVIDDSLLDDNSLLDLLGE